MAQKSATFNEANSGQRIEINPNFIVAKIEGRKNGRATVFIYTTIVDTCFEVEGTLEQVNAKFEDK